MSKGKGENSRVLTFGVEGFNVLNHPNVSNYVGTVGSPLFGQPTAALAGRQMQVSARFKF
jgi:hypothetical protein